MHAFITHMRAREGQRDEVIRLTTVMLEKTQSEQGIPVYVFSTAADSPDDFWFYDIYESDEARAAHEASEEFGRTMGALMEVAELVSVDVYGGARIVHDGMGQELVTYNKGDVVTQAWTGSVLATCSPGNVREELVDPLGFSEAPSVHWSALGGVSLCYRGLLFAGDDWSTDGWLMFAQR